MSEEHPTPNRYPLGEPSVLDYVKSLLHFRSSERIEIPHFVEEKQPSAVDGQVAEVQPAPVNEQPFPVQQQVEETGAVVVAADESRPIAQASEEPAPVLGPFLWRSVLASIPGVDRPAAL